MNRLDAMHLGPPGAHVECSMLIRDSQWDTTHNITIQSLASGIEEFSTQAVSSVPGGSELLVAVGDDNGFTFTSASSLKTSPQKTWDNPFWATSPDVGKQDLTRAWASEALVTDDFPDYAGNVPANIVRVGNAAGAQMISISSDGGVSWNIDYGSSTTDYGGYVAYGANADTIIWSSSTSGVLRSQYQSTFATVSTLPSGALIASDKRNGTVFYGGSSGSFYVSKDTGSTFTKAGALGSATSVVDIAPHPTTAGTVYVSTNLGVFKSTNYGSTFSQLSTAITATQQISLGLPASGTTWYLYAFGNGVNGNKLYASADDGSTWTDIQGSQGFGPITACRLAGSGNTAGQVYVGSGVGRGVYYASGSLTGGTGTTSTTSSTSKSATTTSKSSTTTASISSTVKTTTTTASSSSSSKTTTTSSATTTTKASSTSTSTAPASTCTVAKYGQCGGDTTYTGCTVCATGSVCTAQNAFYSQCL